MTSDRSRAAEPPGHAGIVCKPSQYFVLEHRARNAINFGNNERMIQFQGRLFQSANEGNDVLRLHI